MTRRSILRVLLSLLLLVSQQMAITHVITHWSGQRTVAAAPRDDGLSKVAAKDPVCGQCLAFAQIAGAADRGARGFAPSEPRGDARPSPRERTSVARTVCAFRSRAPPVA
jgi:hypothetical protein